MLKIVDIIFDALHDKFDRSVINIYLKNWTFRAEFSLSLSLSLFQYT